MGIKRHKPEEIVTKLRQVEVLVGCLTSAPMGRIEDEILNIRSSPEIADSTLFSPGPIRTPLLDWYLNRQQTDREVINKGGDPEIEKRILEGKHAECVFNKVKEAIQHGNGKIGFSDAVRRIELLSASLIDKKTELPSANS